MIIRILSEGQWTVPEDALPNLNQLDAQVDEALEDGDQARLTSVVSSLLAEVRAKGEKVPDDVLSESDLILPTADITLTEMRKWLAESDVDQGLIPG